MGEGNKAGFFGRVKSLFGGGNTPSPPVSVSESVESPALAQLNLRIQQREKEIGEARAAGKSALLEELHSGLEVMLKERDGQFGVSSVGGEDISEMPTDRIDTGLVPQRTAFLSASENKGKAPFAPKESLERANEGLDRLAESAIGAFRKAMVGVTGEEKMGRTAVRNMEAQVNEVLVEFLRYFDAWESTSGKNVHDTQTFVRTRAQCQEFVRMVTSMEGQLFGDKGQHYALGQEGGGQQDITLEAFGAWIDGLGEKK